MIYTAIAIIYNREVGSVQVDNGIILEGRGGVRERADDIIVWQT